MKKGPYPKFDARELRKVLGAYVTGVTVVTTLDESGKPCGFTANSFTSVSLDPPLVLVCIAKQAHVAPIFIGATHFAINILASDQSDISAAFGTPAGTRFAEVDFANGTTGSPIIDDVAACLECDMYNTIEQGDHVLLVGRVLAYRHSAANPLGYCRGAYVTFDLAMQALRAASDQKSVVIGAVVEYEHAILLLDDDRGLHLPTAARFGSASEADSLMGKLTEAGVTADLSFVFAVFEDRDNGVQNIFYRGEASRPLPQTTHEFVRFDDIPWATLPNDAIRTMLRRYVKERRQEMFGVYVGDMDSGTVRSLS